MRRRHDGPLLLLLLAAEAWTAPRTHSCADAPTCPPLDSSALPLSNGHSTPPFSVLAASNRMVSPAFVTVSCRPWGFDYFHAIAKYFNWGAITSLEGQYLNPSLGAMAKAAIAAGRSAPTSPGSVCGYAYTHLERLGLGHQNMTAEKPRECGLILDIGANQGWWMLPPLSRCWRVLAFEPLPVNMEQQRLNVFLNGWGPERVGLVHAAAQKPARR